MPQANMEPEEIIEQFGLPSSQEIIQALVISTDVLEKEVACLKDFHKQGNNPPSYLNVRSIKEFIEDEYDGFVQKLYNRAETEISYDDMLSSFKQMINQDLANYVVVKNTGRAYLADENDRTSLKVK
ncbi:hypothetical protein HC026_10565 [Lactobacillus sp. LC28-10]|uniref:Uncharacterized protein n=1 Tax=Secundilactobacillus angelensis TaxID=2722706 RepID=A0ABX1KZG6_9LACO|nr:hypothetical protein [Secundilactobacillus angelensis]MCH5463003.1 hypothetical protein [Secundilactobacillus angelensis]NLR19334.1 hypothetical protein [Secundilactobacillus angelensis]